ncbi:15946_t:CDS:2, partial [Funneliformis geosporum]
GVEKVDKSGYLAFMDPIARKAVNLNVLRRHDQNIVEIVDSSSHVVVYKFDHEQGAWTKKGVEGTLFVFKRCEQPVYGFIVMNRLGIDNFMAPLTDSMELEFKDEYIIYHTDDVLLWMVDNIHGIWVFETKDRERIGKRLWECRELSKTVVTPPQLPLQSSSHYSSNLPTFPQRTSYGRPIDLDDLLQQPEIKQATTSIDSRSSTPAHHETPSHDIAKKDILGELFQKASIVELTRPTPPLANPASVMTDNNNKLLDGKLLLEMIRQPQSKHSNTSNVYPHITHTPPTRSLSVNETRSSSQFSSASSVLTNNIKTPISIIPENSVTTSNVLFGTENPQLPRTYALDASIASLPIITGGSNHKRILTKSEFIQQYYQLIQSDPSFLDILYQNYVVKAQNM